MDDAGVWIYVSESNSYLFMPRDTLPAEVQALSPRDPFKPFLNAGQEAAGAKVIREEVIEISGTKVDCYVLSLSIPGLGPAGYLVDCKVNLLCPAPRS
jgi:hypothetical protein